MYAVRVMPIMGLEHATLFPLHISFLSLRITLRKNNPSSQGAEEMRPLLSPPSSPSSSQAHLPGSTALVTRRTSHLLCGHSVASQGQHNCHAAVARRVMWSPLFHRSAHQGGCLPSCTSGSTSEHFQHGVGGQNKKEQRCVSKQVITCTPTEPCPHV